MKKLVRELIGILGALIAWWAMAVMVGIAMYAIWPSTESSFIAGVSLAPQNIPGNLIGFILALYAFRAITARSPRKSGE